MKTWYKPEEKISMSPLTKNQVLSIAKVALYVGLSAVIDYLISLTTEMQFGQLTPLINLVLVTVKKLFTRE